MLWSLATRHAIREGEFDLRSGLAYLDDEAAEYWAERLNEAEHSDPKQLNPNGWVVAAFRVA